MINIWIGCDDQFKLNFQPQVNSIISNANSLFNIKLLRLSELSDVITRPRDPNQSTDSAFTRWIIPHLHGYTGWHLYMDSDMFVCKDLNKLWNLRDNSKAVMVVKHNIEHTEGTKFNDMPQKSYPRKNWSSLMMFNAKLCTQLTPEYVNTASGLDLHQFKWLDDDLIGELPGEWNHLVGIDPPNPNPGIIHWTLGGPWFPKYKNVEHADTWNTFGQS